MKYKLSDLAFYNNEKIEIDKIDRKNYISTENMLPNKSGFTTAEKIPKVKKVNAYKNDDILISNIRPYFKKIWFADREGGHSADVLNFRAKNEVNPKYLYALLFQDSFFNQMVHSSKGTKMPRGDKNALMNLEFRVPAYNVQKKIGDILFYFQDKIELNNQIISTLEEIASTLFKRWFVDFEFPDENGNSYKSSGGKMVDSELGEIPEGWKAKRIGDINITVSDHVANGSFKSLKENVNIVEEKSYALFLRNVDLKANLNSQLRYVDKSSYEFLKKSQLFGGEVIISNVADVGTVHLVPKLNSKMVLGNNQIYLNSDITYMNLFMYLFFKFSKGQDLIKSITSGSAQMKFNKTDFRNLKIVVPNLYGMGIFDKIQKQIEVTKYENKVLANLRDSLLPKLLSGEIELTNTEEE